MTNQEARELYQQGEAVTVAYLVEITNRLKAIEAKFSNLEARLNLNSQNSSKPPSTDRKKTNKNRSLRKNTQRKPGAQPGHTGKTLEKVDHPDEVISHLPQACPHCQTKLEGLEANGYTARQVFEIPDPKILVSEHRAFCVTCPCCAKEAKADFPQGVEQPVQYGARILGFATYLSADHLVPYARVVKIIQEFTGVAFSQGTLDTALQNAFVRLEDFELHLILALHRVGILHVDETGGFVNKVRYWFHVRCTKTLTYLFCHKNRGKGAVLDLLTYTGRLVSDFFASYVNLDCLHQFCMAHICRELVGVFEKTKQSWAKELKEHLEHCNAACHAARERGSAKLWNARILASEYDDFVATGIRANPLAPAVLHPKTGKLVPATLSCARALLERLRDYREDCLAFLFDLSIPFTNNEAERGVRMLKVKSKISGCFRTLEGATRFCRLRSYLQTCGKQGLNRLDCLCSVFRGEPILPAIQMDG
jgi:transposase